MNDDAHDDDHHGDGDDEGSQKGDKNFNGTGYIFRVTDSSSSSVLFFLSLCPHPHPMAI